MKVRFTVPLFHATLVVGVLLSASAMAQVPTELEEVHFSGDIHNALPGDGGATALAGDHTISAFNFSTAEAVGINYLGELDGAGIDGFHLAGDGCGPSVFSLDATAEISGTVVGPGDIFTDSGVVILDSASEGMPDGVNVDAVSRQPGTCLLVFSIDVHAILGGAAFDPGDLISWESGSGFALHQVDNFDIDIDALHLHEEGRYFISTTTDHPFSGGVARDEDIVEIIPDGPGSLQEIVFSPRTLNDTWAPTDLDGLWVMPQGSPGIVHWEVSQVVFDEDGGNVSLVVERVDGSQGAIDVDWTVSPGSAVEGDDFIGGSGTLPLADGATGGSVQIPVLDDAVEECDETFTVTLTAVSGGASIGTPSTVTVVIADDETSCMFADRFEG